MERLSYNIINGVKKLTDVYTIISYKGKKYLLFFMKYAFFKSLFLIRKVDCIHLSDPVLAGLGYFLKILSKKPVIYNVHGLDLVYPCKIYQWYLKLFFRPDKLICNSRYTESLAHSKGYKNTAIIPLGINPNDFTDENVVDIKTVSEKFKIPILSNNMRAADVLVGPHQPGKKMIITVGRLAERKGVAWFVENVVPDLPDDVIYVVIGEGKQRNKIERIIESKKLHEKVYLTGRIEQQFLNSFYIQADLFIMPNIHIENDVEGFGFVAIEAAARRLPVIAAGIEGITDAIIDGENGTLVESGNADAFRKEIERFLSDEEYRVAFGKKAKEYTFAHYNWDDIAKIYLRELTNL